MKISKSGYGYPIPVYDVSRARFSYIQRKAKELKDKINTVPQMRQNHMFEEVERGLRELLLMIDAFIEFKSGFFSRLNKSLKTALLIAVVLFFRGEINFLWTLVLLATISDVIGDTLYLLFLFL